MDSIHQLIASIGGGSFAILMLVIGFCIVLTIALSIQQNPRDFFAALWRGVTLSLIFLGVLALVAVTVFGLLSADIVIASR